MTPRPQRRAGRHGPAGFPYPGRYGPTRRRRPGWLVVSAGITAVGLLMWFFVAIFILALANEMPVPVLLGVALLVGSPLYLLVPPAGALLWQVVIRPSEERFLLDRFGAEYAAYRAAVPLWVPRRPRGARAQDSG